MIVLWVKEIGMLRFKTETPVQLVKMMRTIRRAATSDSLMSILMVCITLIRLLQLLMIQHLQSKSKKRLYLILSMARKTKKILLIVPHLVV